MKQQMKWLFALAFVVAVATLFVACGDEGATTSPTGTSSVSGDRGAVALADARAHGDDDSSDDASDDDSDDPSDDDSDDDASSDDDSSDDDGSGDDGDEARGLFFGVEACPADAPACVLAIRIKDTLVVVTDETRIDNEPALMENLTPAELLALIDGRFGLPLRARGVASGSGVVASRIRIDDEIRASGAVVSPASGCNISLAVRDGVVLCFSAPGLEIPPVGSQVRIEGLVPVDLVSPYRAISIERTDD